MEAIGIRTAGLGDATYIVTVGDRALANGILEGLGLDLIVVSRGGVPDIVS
ncbi:MAG: hypothetical protein GY720_09065 [bacterium]|nr:hypothetical protein [bacterium]